jgi:hypothetical protein
MVAYVVLRSLPLSKIRAAAILFYSLRKIKNDDLVMSCNDIIFLASFVKIFHLVQELEVWNTQTASYLKFCVFPCREVEEA